MRVLLHSTSKLNTNHASAAGQRLYVTMFPCNECAKIIIQSGVAQVVYFVEKRLNSPDVAYIASHKLLSLSFVYNVYIQFCTLVC
ncbi:hypothetical protein DVH24_008513 [Malus domestica]|uniref:dCMP deaminase n=1 Tax=Malus domestica TaxID=3750 RepID=A0A498JQ62_MALDO|nr:hypothetical protein DVH24_008513 [Malus domestica]